MYIWVGCKLPESFETEIRSLCLKQNEALGLDTVAFSLPQHISLKISFETAAYEAVLEALTAFLSKQQPFSVRIRQAEQAGNILWMPVAENEVLRQLHTQLDALLEKRFCIGQHEFDKCFLFHSTLFMDADAGKIASMQESLAQYPVEREMPVDTFLLGLSETGKPGECRIVRQIRV